MKSKLEKRKPKLSKRALRKDPIFQVIFRAAMDLAMEAAAVELRSRARPLLQRSTPHFIATRPFRPYRSDIDNPSRGGANAQREILNFLKSNREGLRLDELMLITGRDERSIRNAIAALKVKLLIEQHSDTYVLGTGRPPPLLILPL